MHTAPSAATVPPAEDDHLDALVINLQRAAVDHPDGEVRHEVVDLVDRARGLFDVSERRRLAHAIRRFCFLRNLPEVLAMSGVPLVYNFGVDYGHNRPAPWDRMPDTDGVTRGRRWTLMGFDIGYPVGIPASVLTANSRWIDYYAANGFNVITYKSVRSCRKDALPFPNWVYVKNLDEPVPVDTSGMPDRVVGSKGTFMADPTSFSTANSFGVPSESPDVWMEDVARTLDSLRDGKLLIVSVMGTPDAELQGEAAASALADDYAAVADMAITAGAQAIEINLSCPNTLAPGGGTQPPVCEDEALTERIVRAVADRVEQRGEQTRIVCKLAWMPKEQLEQLVSRFAELVHCISGINTMPAHVVDDDGNQTFAARDVAGISGVAIRDFGRDFVQSMHDLRLKHGWPLSIIGMGGVMDADDVRALLDAGADAVQTATAASHNPTLPFELLQQPESALSPTARVVLQAMPPEPQAADLVALSTDTHMAISVVHAGLAELERHGIVAGRRNAEKLTYVLQAGS